MNEVRLEELLSVPIRNGLTKPSKIRGTGIKMIGMGELFANDRISSSMEMDLVPVTEKEKKTSLISKNDLLFARQSLVLEGAGKCSIVVDDSEPIVFESHLIRARIDQKKADPYYLYYYFKSPQGKGNIRSIVEQVAAAGIRGKDLIKLRVPCPKIDTQHRIAEILGCFDRKIETNNRIIDNLSKQVSILYKEWFVDKAMREWERVPMSDLIFFQEGPGIRNWQYVLLNGVKFINIRCISDGEINTSTANMISTEEAYGKYSHFLLQPYDIVMSCSGTLGRYAIVREDHLPLCLNTSVIRFRPKNSFEDYSFVYGYMTSKEFLKKQIIMANGSAQVNFGPTHLRQIQLLKPPINLRKEFHRIVMPLIEAMIKAHSENYRLGRIRDTLLPKMISGDIDVFRAT